MTRSSWIRRVAIGLCGRDAFWRPRLAAQTPPGVSLSQSAQGDPVSGRLQHTSGSLF